MKVIKVYLNIVQQNINIKIIVKFNLKCYYRTNKLLEINSINKGEIFYVISNEV